MLFLKGLTPSRQLYYNSAQAMLWPHLLKGRGKPLSQLPGVLDGDARRGLTEGTVLRELLVERGLNDLRNSMDQWELF